MSRKEEYRQELKDPRWRELRLEMLRFRRNTCEECGENDTIMHVHHKRYVWGRKAWEYEFNDLQVLCHRCHEWEHVSPRQKAIIMHVFCGEPLDPKYA